LLITPELLVGLSIEKGKPVGFVSCNKTVAGTKQTFSKAHVPQQFASPAKSTAVKTANCR
jgi:hypothetical protein